MPTCQGMTPLHRAVWAQQVSLCVAGTMRQFRRSKSGTKFLSSNGKESPEDFPRLEVCNSVFAPTSALELRQNLGRQILESTFSGLKGTIKGAPEGAFWGAGVTIGLDGGERWEAGGKGAHEEAHEEAVDRAQSGVLSSTQARGAKHEGRNVAHSSCTSSSLAPGTLDRLRRGQPVFNQIP